MSGMISRIGACLVIGSAVYGCGGGISPEEIEEHALHYTEAWNSGDPAAVASHFSAGGSLQVNDAAPAVGREAIAGVARGFMTLSLTWNCRC